MSSAKVEGFRLSPQQRYLWSVQQASASYIYQVLSTITINGDLRLDVLQRALSDVVRRHEILRTTFQRPLGMKTPFQVISDKEQFSWHCCDLTDLSQEERANQLNNLDQPDQPFDFERGPLLRVSVYKLSSDQHILLISLPALCADAVSVSHLMREVARRYGQVVQSPEISDEPTQYADFGDWHSELLEASDEQAGAGKKYWQALVAAVSSLSLPLEKRRRGGEAFQPGAVSVDLDSQCVANVERLARECGASIQLVLFAIWQALVGRLTNRVDFLIFNLFDGRTLEDLGNAIGPYAKYLPVRSRCEETSFAANLETTRAAISEAEEWQDYFDSSNFAEAARDSVAFDFVNEVSADPVAGLEFSLTKQELHLSPFKLKLTCFRSEDSIRAELLYDSNSFDRATANRYAGYFAKLLAQTRPATTIWTIDILNPEERQRLLVEINRTASDLSAATCIHDLFEDQVERTPDATALICGDRQLTYSELNASANQLAHLLRRRGLAANGRAGICMERSAETIIAIMGILKAGGAYVPLNPQHPQLRLALQLAESNASALIVNGGAAVESLAFSGEIIDFERDRELLSAEPASNPAQTGPAASLAYIIYTSGSAGVPKGVAVRHQALVNYTQFILRRLQVKEPLNFGTVSTITADLGNTCIFPALVSGGCLHLISYDIAMEGARFLDYVAKHPLDVLKIVPSHFNALFTAAGSVNILPTKFLIFGGEALSWDLVERISRANPSCAIINHYGPTETTVGSLTFAVEMDQTSTETATVPVGQPIANTCVYVLDQQFNVAATGVPGELYIGGAGLALGYLNMPGETAARFLPHLFSDQPGERLYRTGDLVRYVSDGNIEFLGRIDHQVKVRGFRVELGEIESVLLKHTGVRAAAVIAEVGTTENERLIAYVVPTGTKSPSIDGLRTFLEQRLPDYMVPSSFVFLTTMPLTSNGKINRAALPAPDNARPNLARVFVAPRTQVEKDLADIWAGFLKLDEVGIHDNFFELGGHSLLATQVVSRMRKTFNCEVPLRSLFESPTIAELAGRIGASTASETERLLAEIEKLSEGEVDAMLKAEQDSAPI